MTALGELDRVPQEVGQDLPDPARVPDDSIGQPRREPHQELEVLGLDARREDRGDVLGADAQVERLRIEIELARLDLEKSRMSLMIVSSAWPDL